MEPNFKARVQQALAEGGRKAPHPDYFGISLKNWLNVLFVVFMVWGAYAYNLAHYNINIFDVAWEAWESGLLHGPQATSRSLMQSQGIAFRQK